MAQVLDVDPRILHVPASRMLGADPGKFARQLSRHGFSTAGMPHLLVVKGKGGALQIYDGVTRATRVAKLLPGQTVRVVVIDTIPSLDLSRFPTIGDLIP